MDANGYQVWGRIANALVYAIVIPHTAIWAELYMRGGEVVEYYGDLWFFIVLVWIVFLLLKAIRYRFEWLNCIPCSPLSPNYPLYLPRAVTLENSILLLFSLFPLFAYYEVLLGVGYFTEHLAETVVFLVLVLTVGYYVPTFVFASHLRRMEKRGDRAGIVAILERMDRQRARHFIYRYGWPDYLLETLIFTALAAMLYLMQLGGIPRGGSHGGGVAVPAGHGGGAGGGGLPAAVALGRLGPPRRCGYAKGHRDGASLQGRPPGDRPGGRGGGGVDRVGMALAVFGREVSLWNTAA